MARITNSTIAKKTAPGTGKERLGCVCVVGGGYPFCCPSPCPTSKLSCGEEEEQPSKVRAEVSRVLREMRWGAWGGQQLDPSPLCRKGPGCCCKSSAEPEPTVLSLCRTGECRSRRNNTEMCRRASRRTCPGTGWGVSGEIWAGWRELRGSIGRGWMVRKCSL